VAGGVQFRFVQASLLLQRAQHHYRPPHTALKHSWLGAAPIWCRRCSLHQLHTSWLF